MEIKENFCLFLFCIKKNIMQINSILQYIVIFFLTKPSFMIIVLPLPVVLVPFCFIVSQLISKTFLLSLACDSYSASTIAVSDCGEKFIVLFTLWAPNLLVSFMVGTLGEALLKICNCLWEFVFFFVVVSVQPWGCFKTIIFRDILISLISVNLF